MIALDIIGLLALLDCKLKPAAAEPNPVAPILLP
jgi:hypothetical protein